MIAGGWSDVTAGICSSVPSPKFVAAWGGAPSTFGHDKDTSQPFESSVVCEFEVRRRGRPKELANFKFAALGRQQWRRIEQIEGRRVRLDVG
jgi:hypothetical protein